MLKKQSEFDFIVDSSGYCVVKEGVARSTKWCTFVALRENQSAKGLQVMEHVVKGKR
jgi:hypothetical protein